MPIYLDSNIRDYVLLPIFLVVLMTNILRTNLLTCLKAEAKVDMKDVKHNNLVARSKMLKAGANFLSEKVLAKRKAYFIKKDVGALMKPPKKADPMAQLSAGPDPMMAMGMLKNQMVFIVIQGGIGYWVSHLFSGFLVAKTPFPLTFQFKGMLQRGVEVSALEPGYVSSLCWYIFVMMSSHGVVGVAQSLLKSNAPAEDDPMAAMMGTMGGMGGMGMAGPGMGGGPDMEKIFKGEQESLEIFNHECLLDNIENELHRKWRAERNSR
jgi:hypothetical protein